ncbi:MAG TPA: pyridoxine 5'-phosphate synthase [Candidatus Omnitrophota bacterium]|nr:pyridoxine 5'-phosphate synthase [Candidatus Omnitrophota bacterium]
MPKLGVNIDHVATLRQARKEFEPDPVSAAKVCEQAGADSIVCHLREDRRHIQDADVKRLRRSVKVPLNLEMSLNNKIVAIAVSIKPDYAMFVPENRREVTTEGGLDVAKNFTRLRNATKRLNKKGVIVSVFVDPDNEQILKAKKTGAKIVELHTGRYANARGKNARSKELNKLRRAASFAKSLGLIVHAGHGLKYNNVRPVATIPGIDELNIGHAIVSRAVFTGLKAAVKEMKKLVK